jgi:hypothetical protein
MTNQIKEIKKKVNEQWREGLSPLTLYRERKFYKLIGPFVAGVELIDLRAGDEFRPCFVCYSLSKDTIGECLDAPAIFFEFRDRKGFQLGIPYLKHDAMFPEALDCVRMQLPFKVDGDVFLTDVLDLVDKYAKMPPLSAAPTSYLQARLQEFRLEIIIFAGDNEQMQHELDRIRRVSWDVPHFNLWKVDVKIWLQGLENKVNHRSELLSRIEKNKNDKSLEKLQRSKILESLDS